MAFYPKSHPNWKQQLSFSVSSSKDPEQSQCQNAPCKVFLVGPAAHRDSKKSSCLVQWASTIQSLCHLWVPSKANSWATPETHKLLSGILVGATCCIKTSKFSKSTAPRWWCCWSNYISLLVLPCVPLIQLLEECVLMRSRTVLILLEVFALINLNNMQVWPQKKGLRGTNTRVH